MQTTADEIEAAAIHVLAQELAREAGIPPAIAARILQRFGADAHLAEAVTLLRRAPRLDDLRLVLRVR